MVFGRNNSPCNDSYKNRFDTNEMSNNNNESKLDVCLDDSISQQNITVDKSHNSSFRHQNNLYNVLTRKLSQKYEHVPTESKTDGSDSPLLAFAPMRQDHNG